MAEKQDWKRQPLLDPQVKMIYEDSNGRIYKKHQTIDETYWQNNIAYPILNFVLSQSVSYRKYGSREKKLKLSENGFSFFRHKCS